LFMTTIILIVVDKTMGLRVSESEEELGLDSSLHGESVIPTGVVNRFDSGPKDVEMATNKDVIIGKVKEDGKDVVVPFEAN